MTKQLFIAQSACESLYPQVKMIYIQKQYLKKEYQNMGTLYCSNTDERLEMPLVRSMNFKSVMESKSKPNPLALN